MGSLQGISGNRRQLLSKAKRRRYSENIDPVDDPSQNALSVTPSRLRKDIPPKDIEKTGPKLTELDKSSPKRSLQRTHSRRLHSMCEHARSPHPSSKASVSVTSTDGRSSPRQTRRAHRKFFRRPQLPRFSPPSGRRGLNLQAASLGINHDLPWNPPSSNSASPAPIVTDKILRAGHQPCAQDTN